MWDEPSGNKDGKGGGKGVSGSVKADRGKSAASGRSKYTVAVAGAGGSDDDENDDAVEEEKGETAATGGLLSADDLKWEDSGKLTVLAKVLPLWYNEGHKVLLFSQTQSMLNLLEVMMKEFSFRYMRLDGSTPVARREGIIETFNKDPTVFLMILSTRTGGVGISLTAANRVVLGKSFSGSLF
jgi:SNF2 family DNA or RNA helicase